MKLRACCRRNASPVAGSSLNPVSGAKSAKNKTRRSGFIGDAGHGLGQAAAWVGIR